MKINNKTNKGKYYLIYKYILKLLYFKIFIKIKI